MPDLYLHPGPVFLVSRSSLWQTGGVPV